jgi:hypothetical protein
MRHEGGCHCGAVSIAFTTAKSPADLGARACQCSFCQTSGATWTSDSDGMLDIDIVGRVHRYRFGTKTADVLVCITCGVAPAIISNVDGRLVGVVRVSCMKSRNEFSNGIRSIDFDGETIGSRVDRRGAHWTPVTLKERAGDA